MSLQKTVEHLTVTITASTEPLTVNLSLGQAFGQCTVRHTMRVTGDIPDLHEERCFRIEVINNGGTAAVKISATDKTDASDHIVHIEVIEWDTSVNVQQVAFTLSEGSTTDTIAITSVGTQASAFMMLSYMFVNDTGAGGGDNFNDGMVTVDFTTTSVTQLTVARNQSDGDIDGVVYVVDCDSGEFTVEHTTIDQTGIYDEVDTVTITAVVLADTFTIRHYSCDENQDDLADGAWNGNLTSTTVYSINRNDGNGSVGESFHNIQIIECQNNEWDVQRKIDLVLNATSVTHDIASAVTVDRSFINFCSHAANPFGTGRIGYNDGGITDDIMCGADFNLETPTSNTVRFRKLDDYLDYDIVSFEVIQFAELEVIHSADGTPSLPSLTSGGVSEIQKKADGTPSLPSLTSGGVSEIQKKASGTPSLPSLTSTGSAAIKKVASGTPTLPSLTSSGSSTVGRLASGTPSLPSLTSSGSSLIKGVASGTPSLPSLTSAGVSTLTRFASGTPSLPLLTSAGTTLVNNKASGAPVLPLLTSTGAARAEHTATGTPSLPLLTSTGAALVSNKASGASVLPLLTSAGIARAEHTASGTPSLPLLTSAGVSEIQKKASGTPSLPLLTSAGTATVDAGGETASGAPSLPLLTSAGTAAVKKAASGTPSLPLLTSAGVAAVKKAASGTPSLPLLTSTGSSRAEHTANGSPSLPLLTATGSAVTKNVASGAPVLPLLTSTGVTAIKKIASGVPTLPLLTSAGVVTQDFIITLVGGDDEVASGETNVVVIGTGFNNP